MALSYRVLMQINFEVGSATRSAVIGLIPRAAEAEKKCGLKGLCLPSRVPNVLQSEFLENAVWTARRNAHGNFLMQESFTRALLAIFIIVATSYEPVKYGKTPGNSLPSL